MVGRVGIEPTMFPMWGVYSALSSPLDIPTRRTDLLVSVVARNGFEPPTQGFSVPRSTVLSYPALDLKTGFEPVIRGPQPRALDH